MRGVVDDESIMVLDIPLKRDLLILSYLIYPVPQPYDSQEGHHCAAQIGKI